MPVIWTRQHYVVGTASVILILGRVKSNPLEHYSTLSGTVKALTHGLTTTNAGNKFCWRDMDPRQLDFNSRISHPAHGIGLIKGRHFRENHETYICIEWIAEHLADEWAVDDARWKEVSKQ